MVLPSTSGVSTKVLVVTSTTVTPSHFRKISFKEMQQRRAQGMYYNCNEKSFPMHKCANWRLLLLQWDEDLSDSTEGSVVHS